MLYSSLTLIHRLSQLVDGKQSMPVPKKSLVESLDVRGKNFFRLDIDALTQEYATRSDSEWTSIGFPYALALFQKAAKRVPAYKDFLQKHNITPSLIQTYEDFQKVPVLTKHNYLRAYSLADMCWDGKLTNQLILSSSSGSTGEPFLWPRGEEQELEGAITYETMFKNFFELDKYSTLYIDCFAMGTWIAGPFVLACAENLARKGYNILTVTPGIERDIVFQLFKSLAPSFDQIVISGYPPFVKDVIDHGEKQGVDWKNYRIRFLFAAEGFSEKWREYIHNKVGAKDHYRTSVNMYGSADAAILAHETPVTTTIRRMVMHDPKSREEIFGDNRLPTLAQYDPRLKFFEEIDGDLIFTTLAGIPLIRYSIGDTGNVVTFTELKKRLQEKGFDLKKELQTNVPKQLQWQLPFVYLFGRTDLTVNFYGLLIYPEHVKYCLEKPALQKSISGKFVISTEYTEEQDQYLLVKIELAPGVKPTEELGEEIQKCIVSGLKKLNSEYNRLSKELKDRAIPVIELVENGDKTHFKPGTKQKWVEKS